MWSFSRSPTTRRWPPTALPLAVSRTRRTNSPSLWNPLTLQGVPLGGIPAADDYTYDGRFSRPCQVFIVWRAVFRVLRWFHGSAYDSMDGIDQTTYRAPETKLRRLDTHQLIMLVVSGDRQGVDALGVLWRKRAYHSRNDNQDLCAMVVRNRLYVEHVLGDANPARVRARVERAAALFDICVRPRPRGTLNDEDLGRLLAKLWDEHGALGRTVVTRIVHSDGALALGDATWRGLFDRALTSSPDSAPAGAAQPGTERRPTRTWEPVPEQPLPTRSDADEPDYAVRRWMIGLIAAWVLAALVFVIVVIA